MVNNFREFICKVGNKKHDLAFILEYRQKLEKVKLLKRR